MMRQRTMCEKQNIDISLLHVKIHEFFVGSRLVAYLLPWKCY